MLHGVDELALIAIKHGMREAREARGFSQTAVGEACGVTQSQVSKWESASVDQWPSFVQLAAFEDRLGVPRGYVLARAGLVDCEPVEAAIAAADGLDEVARKELLSSYRTVLRMARRRARG